MTKVVRFPHERTHMSKARYTNGKAEVIIFPGVRIERREFCLADRKAKSRRTKTPVRRP